MINLREASPDKKKTEFINYLNQEYGNKTKKIRKYDPQINRDHDFRVKSFKRELQKISTEN